MGEFTTDIVLLNAVVATTTQVAPGVAVGDRSNLGIQVSGTAITSGNGVFKIQVSNDGINWVYYNRLVQNSTVTAGSTPALVNSETISANGSKFLFVPDGDHFKYIRASVTRTTDGTYTAILHGV